MAQIPCKYHSDMPARWSCRHCHINFCSACSAPPPQGDPACPVCARPLDSLGAGNAITPFWQRIPRFFLYPAQPSALLFMVVLTLLSALAGYWLFGFLLQLVFAVVFVKYAYVVLEHTAQGHLQAPPLTAGSITDELELPFKQFLLLFGLTAANFTVLEFFGPAAFGLTVLLTVFTLPAAVMVLAVEHSLLAAVNPVMVVGMLTRIGAPYLILAVFLLILTSSSGIALGLLGHVLPEPLYLPLNHFLEMYFVLIMFNMMGYVIYQYHEVLGYGVEESVAEVRAAEPASPALRQVEILLQEGKFDAAKAALFAHLKEAPEDFAAHAHCHRLLQTLGAGEEFVGHGREYLSRLLRAGRRAEAARVFKDCHAVDPNCRVAEAGQIYLLAQALAERGEAKLALGLLNNFHKLHPQHPDVPQAYFLAARLFSERLGRDEEAVKVLRFLVGSYSDHVLSGEIQAYLDVLTGNGARPARAAAPTA